MNVIKMKTILLKGKDLETDKIFCTVKFSGLYENYFW
jgi:hypothetical protein